MASTSTIWGGPQTKLPRFVESFLAWALALSCLSVSGYYYIVGTVLPPYIRLLKDAIYYCWTSLLFPMHHHDRWVGSSASDDGTSCSSTAASSTNHHHGNVEQNYSSDSSAKISFPVWLPLTTFSRSEMDAATQWERYQQFLRRLTKVQQLRRTSFDTVKGTKNEQRTKVREDACDCEEDTSIHECDERIGTQTVVVELDVASASDIIDVVGIDDEHLVSLVRSDVELRRLASLMMRPVNLAPCNPSGLSFSSTSPQTEGHKRNLKLEGASEESKTGNNEVHFTKMGQQLIRLWPRLLELPSPLTEINEFQEHGESSRSAAPTTPLFAISLIVPCYRENGSIVAQHLQRSLAHCDDPQSVQVIVVNAGFCVNLPSSFEDQLASRPWGEIKVVSFHQDDSLPSGRGPTLNFGATFATGSIVSFCHSDTQLPIHWDSVIRQAILGSGPTSADALNASRQRPRVTCSAFGFGIDKSPRALSSHVHDVVYANRVFPPSQGHYYPPGLRAIEFTANLRCQWWSLPYGDQCLSFPTNVFRYIGGFPSQELMEDYELVSLIRKRVALLPQFGDETSNARETLQMLPGLPALCSARRWQKFGVLYVTFTNSKLVRLYSSHGVSPREIYQRYYS
jgi:hypothetical protein